MMKTQYQHLLKDPRHEKLIGYAAIFLGFYLLYGAYDRRGKNKPKIMGPILPW